MTTTISPGNQYYLILSVIWVFSFVLLQIDNSGPTTYNDKELASRMYAPSLQTIRRLAAVPGYTDGATGPFDLFGYSSDFHKKFAGGNPAPQDGESRHKKYARLEIAQQKPSDFNMRSDADGLDESSTGYRQGLSKRMQLTSSITAHKLKQSHTKMPVATASIGKPEEKMFIEICQTSNSEKILAREVVAPTVLLNPRNERNMAYAPVPLYTDTSSDFPVEGLNKESGIMAEQKRDQNSPASYKAHDETSEEQDMKNYRPRSMDYLSMLLTD